MHVPWELPSALPSAPRLAQGPVPLDQNDLSGGQLSPRGSLGGRRPLGPVTRQKTEAGGHTALWEPLPEPRSQPSGPRYHGPPPSGRRGHVRAASAWQRVLERLLGSPQPAAAVLRPAGPGPFWGPGTCSLSWRAGPWRCSQPLGGQPQVQMTGENHRGSAAGGGPSCLQSSSSRCGEPPTGQVPAHTPSTALLLSLGLWGDQSPSQEHSPVQNGQGPPRRRMGTPTGWAWGSEHPELQTWLPRSGM